MIMLHNTLTSADPIHPSLHPISPPTITGIPSKLTYCCYCDSITRQECRYWMILLNPGFCSMTTFFFVHPIATFFSLCILSANESSQWKDKIGSLLMPSRTTHWSIFWSDPSIGRTTSFVSALQTLYKSVLRCDNAMVKVWLGLRTKTTWLGKYLKIRETWWFGLKWFCRWGYGMIVTML